MKRKSALFTLDQLRRTAAAKNNAHLFENATKDEKPKRRKKGDVKEERNEQGLLFFRHCESYGLPTPTPEYEFDEGLIRELVPEYYACGKKRRKFRADFAWLDAKVILEVDGGIWRKGGGAHSRPQNILRDQIKSNLAQLLGWKIIRVTPDKLYQPETLNLLKTAIYGTEKQ